MSTLALFGGVWLCSTVACILVLLKSFDSKGEDL